MDKRSVTNIALASRVAFGAAAWVAPDATFKPFGVKPAPGSAMPYVARLFGARDVALGVLGLVAKGEARRTILTVLAAADVLDAGAAVWTAKKGQVSWPAAALLVAGGAVVFFPEVDELRS